MIPIDFGNALFIHRSLTVKISNLLAVFSYKSTGDIDVLEKSSIDLIWQMMNISRAHLPMCCPVLVVLLWCVVVCVSAALSLFSCASGAQLLPSPRSNPHLIRRISFSGFRSLGSESPSYAAGGGASRLGDPEVPLVVYEVTVTPKIYM